MRWADAHALISAAIPRSSALRRAGLCLGGFFSGVGGGLVLLALVLGDTAPFGGGGATKASSKENAVAIEDKTTDVQVTIAPSGLGRGDLTPAETRLLQVAKAVSDVTPSPISYRAAKTDRIFMAPPPPEVFVAGTIREGDPVRTSASMVRPSPETPRSPVKTAVRIEDTRSAPEVPIALKKPSRPTKAKRQRATVSGGVNMRARPDNGAAVLSRVPAGSPIDVIKCDYWCEVVFAGERGWIYKGFVRRTGSS